MKNTFKKHIGRTLSIFVVIFLLLGTIPIVGVSAAENEVEYKYFLKDDNTVELTLYEGNDKDVIVPETINGYPVTSIDYWCFFQGKNIESIYIPSSVTTLYLPNEEGEVFSGNTSLKSIVVDEKNSNFSSEDGVLYNKSKTKILAYPIDKPDTNITISKNVSEIGIMAFYYNKNLTSIKFDGNIQSIGSGAFAYQNSLKEFYYPELVSATYPILDSCYTHVDVYISKDISVMNDEDFIDSDVTLHVYNNSYALDWAKEHEFAYEIMEEPPIEKDLVDEGTGIKVKGTMDPDATLKVEKVESTVEDAVATYDITLRKDGDVIQPSGTITISIPSEIKDCKLFWVKDDGTKVEVNAIYENGNYVFTTDHLSVYALVKEPEPTTTEPVETTTAEPVTTVSVPTTTEPVETTTAEPVTTVPVPTTTEPVETTTAEPVTTVPVPTTTESVETTTAEPVTTVPVPTTTEPVETTTAEPLTTVEPVTTVPTTDPVTTVEPTTKSVATPDTPIDNNNSNSGNNSSSGSSTTNTNTSNGAVATGNMLGFDNNILIAIIIAATTALIAASKRRNSSK